LGIGTQILLQFVMSHYENASCHFSFLFVRIVGIYLIFFKVEYELM